jgi:hypothetical protein
MHHWLSAIFIIYLQPRNNNHSLYFIFPFPTRRASANKPRKGAAAASLQELAAQGHPDDVRYVVQRIEAFLRTSQVTQFALQLPASRAASDTGGEGVLRLRSWLERLGFTESAFGSGTAYLYNSSVRHEMKRK